MTLRAFLLGLASVIAISLLDPYTSYHQGYGWNTQGHFPVAAVFLLVVVTVGLNALLKAVRRGLALRQAELMLIWCMLIVGFAVPSNPMRLGPPMLAAPAYLARRPDIPWRDTALAAAPADLVLTKNPRSLAAEQFFEGWRGEGRVPWAMWLTPLSRWAVFVGFYFLAVFFMCAAFRRQWVDRERLQFPLARIPMEFTEGSGSAGLLPNLFSNRAFQMGLLAAAVLRFAKAMPLFFGADTGWSVSVPFMDVLADTPLQYTYFQNVGISWASLGLAYILPADVSLSIWLFYLFGRFELQTAAWLGSDVQQGGTYSALMRWQRPGAYLAFTAGTLFMARRHLADLVAGALRRGGTTDDAEEPVSYGLAFWGFLICAVGAVAWFFFCGMKLWVACVFFAILMLVELVHARLVAQSGIFTTAPLSGVPVLMHSLGAGRVFGRTGIVVAQMQYGFLTGANNSLLGPAAIHSFRISSVFEKGRRWLLPAVVTSLAAALVASGYIAIYQGYRFGALNFANVWSMTGNPQGVFDTAHRIIALPEQVGSVSWVPLLLGISTMSFVMFMRARFYWWPIHSVGLLAFSSYTLDRIWFSFMLGWLVKQALLRLGTGTLVRGGRYFFIGFIMTHFFLSGVATVLTALSGGSIPTF